jgi:hypothetical protein
MSSASGFVFKSPAYRYSSGGIDSASSAVIVYSMCRLVVEAVKAGNEQVIADVRMICAEDEWLPATPQELCGKIFHTCMRSLNSIQGFQNFVDMEFRLHGHGEE